MENLGTYILSLLAHVLNGDWITFYQVPIVNSCVSNVIGSQVNIRASYDKVCNIEKLSQISLLC